MTCSLPIPGFKWSYRNDPYGTHQPILHRALCETKNSEGPIAELGCGFNSTELIHRMAGSRTVYSLDHTKEWLSKFEHMATQDRRFHLINSWYDIIRYFSSETDLSVVFIDQGDWTSRAQCIEFFKNRSEIVLIHDSDYLLSNKLINRYEDHYKHVKTFMPPEPYPYMTGPPTTVMSNNIDVSKWEIDYNEY